MNYVSLGQPQIFYGDSVGDQRSNFPSGQYVLYSEYLRLEQYISDLIKQRELPMQDYQARVVQEHADLTEKLFKLKSFMKQNIYSSLDKAEQLRLDRQAQYMELYERVLGERIAVFSQD